MNWCYRAFWVLSFSVCDEIFRIREHAGPFRNRISDSQPDDDHDDRSPLGVSLRDVTLGVDCYR